MEPRAGTDGAPRVLGALVSSSPTHGSATPASVSHRESPARQETPAGVWEGDTCNGPVGWGEFGQLWKWGGKKVTQPEQRPARKVGMA